MASYTIWLSFAILLCLFSCAESHVRFVCPRPASVRSDISFTNQVRFPEFFIHLKVDDWKSLAGTGAEFDKLVYLRTIKNKWLLDYVYRLETSNVLSETIS